MQRLLQRIVVPALQFHDSKRIFDTAGVRACRAELLSAKVLLNRHKYVKAAIVDSLQYNRLEEIVQMVVDRLMLGTSSGVPGTAQVHTARTCDRCVQNCQV